MKEGQNTGLCDSNFNPIKVGDKLKTKDGTIYTISPYGSALNKDKEAYPLKKICENEEPYIWVDPTASEKRDEAPYRSMDSLTLELPKPEAEPVKVPTPHLLCFTDDELANELARRGYSGAVTKNLIIGIN